MEKTAQSVLFIRCFYNGEIKLTGVVYRAHTHQTTNKHKIIIQQMRHTHTHNVHSEARLNLCTLDSSQMVTLFSPWGSRCMLLFTTIHILQNIITMTGVCYYISSQNLLFICQCQLHVC